jgi:hypothetical protein
MVTKVTSIRTCKLAEKCYTLQNIKDQNWKNIKIRVQTEPPDLQFRVSITKLCNKPMNI